MITLPVERETRLQKAHDEARMEAAICREEGRKERAFYREEIAALREHIKHLTALIPVYSHKHTTLRRSSVDGP